MKIKFYRYRSAKTGRYVTETYAKRCPNQTVRESVVWEKIKEYARKAVAIASGNS